MNCSPTLVLANDSRQMSAFLKACADRLCLTRGTPYLPGSAVRVVIWRRHGQGRYRACHPQVRTGLGSSCRPERNPGKTHEHEL